jgi:putative ABC transport system permease protein
MGLPDPDDPALPVAVACSVLPLGFPSPRTPSVLQINAVRVLLAYQFRLAARGLRWRPGLSVTTAVVLSLVGGMWTFSVCRYLRHYGPFPALSPALHQVDLLHRGPPAEVRALGSTHTTADWATHTRVSFPEYQALASSGIPARQAASFRSRLLVARPDAGGPAGLARSLRGRFADAPFFSLFAVPFAHGRPFTASEQAAGEAVAVIGHRLNRTLFGGADSVGRALLVEGRPFRIVGVIDGDQPFRATWDLALTDSDQDALYLPFGWFRTLRAGPEAVVPQGAAGARLEDLLRSPALFVSFWLELPDPASRAAYLRHLQGRFGSGYLLRSYAEWTRAFRPAPTRVAFLSSLGALFLLAGGLSTMRLLLTRGAGRRHELGIRRALGASRRMIFASQLLEAAILSLAAGLAGVALAVPHLLLFNTVVIDADIPARLTAPSILIGLGGVFLTGLAAAVYPSWSASNTSTALYAVRG